MKNIFENAYFGKPYKTRDERKALYHDVAANIVSLILPDFSFSVWLDGSFEDDKESNLDIVSEWHEEINEEELDNLAIKLIHETIDDFQDGEKVTFNLLKDLVKASYRKAMEK